MAKHAKKPRTLLNIKLSPAERMLARECAVAAGLSVAELIRKLLRDEAARLMQSELGKDKGGQ
jgi:hypothetical protein